MGNPEAKPKQVLKLNRVMEKVRDLYSNPIYGSKLHTPNHPPYALMIRRAIVELNEGAGLSEEAISEFIMKEYDVLPFAHGGFLRHHLRKLCERREVVRVNDGQYIIPVERQSKKRKRHQGMGKKTSRLSRVEDKDGKEKEGRKIGEGNQTLEQEVERQTEEQEIRLEGIDEQKKEEKEQKEVAEKAEEGKDENTKVVEEQSISERQQMEVAEVQIERTDMELNNGGVSDEVIMQHFIKEKHEAFEKLNKEHNEHNEAVRQTVEQEVEGQTEQQEIRLKGIDEQKKGEEWPKEVSEKAEEGKEENPEVVEEQSISERQQMEVTDVQIEGTSMELNNGGVSDEVIIHQLVKTKHGAEDTQSEVIEQKLGISSEQNEPQPQQTEVIEKPFQLAEVQNQQQPQQQDRDMKLNYKTMSASTLNKERIESGEIQNEMIEEQQLEISSDKKDSQSQQTELTEEQFQLAEVQNQKQEQDKETKLNDKTKSASTLNKEHIESGELQNEMIEEQQLEMSSERNDSECQQTEVIEEQFQPGEVKKQQQEDKTKLNRNTRSASPLTANTTPIDPSSNAQQVDLEALSELPITQLFPWLKSTKKNKLSLPQKQEHDQCQLQKRKLRSYNQPNVPELATDTAIFEQPMLSKHQGEPQQQAKHRGKEKKYQLRCPKLKKDTEMDLEAELPLDCHHHDKEQPLKLRAQETPPKPRSDTDAIVEIVPHLDLQDQNEKLEQSQDQLPQRLLQSHNQEPSISEPPAPTITLSSASPKHQDDQQQQAQDQVLGKRRGRPPKPKTEEEEEKPPKRPGRGRPPKLKQDPDTSAVIPQLPTRGRGRPPKAKQTPHKGHHLEEQPWRKGRGRPPKPKSEPDTVTVDSQTSQTEPLQSKHQGRGRPPKSQ